jgi:hypothetical protein
MGRPLLATSLVLAWLATLAASGAVGCAGPASTGGSTATDDGSVEPADAGPDVLTATDGGAGAQDGDDPDACAPCASTLDQVCAGDAGLECPPDLGSPGFFDWAQRQIGFDWGGQGRWRAPLCAALATCQELVRIDFGVGVDCDDEFLFDATTKKLVAVVGGCLISSCSASAACLPNRCVPVGPYPGSTESAACPALPDAGPPDANATSSCSIPVSANTYSNATDSGCQAFAQFCTPPCATACPSGQYQLLCSGPPGTVDAAPAPVPSLNCTTDGGSQSSNTTEYCCQCLP